MNLPTTSRAVDETLGFLDLHLTAPRRLLDAGCGRGEYAVALAARGHEVTALDVELLDPPPPARRLTFARADFLQYEGGPFDAVVFVTSLHHLFPLDAALDRAARLLLPGGLLIAEEFAVESPDDPTARWFYETQEWLAAAGLLDRDRLRGPAHGPPLRRWQHEHEHDEHPLSTAAAMRNALGRRFELIAEDRGPYLYRAIEARVRASLGASGEQRARSVGDALFEEERRRLSAGELRSVGVRLVARRR